MIAGTYPLWFPGFSAENAFPSVPLLGLFCGLPKLIDWLLSLFLCLGWLLLLPGYRSRIGYGLVLLCASALIMSNQHRLQPWHYQFSIFAWIFLLVPSDLQRLTLRWLVISIYFFSALSKFDFEFLHTVGPQLLDAGLSLFTKENLLDAEQKFLLAWLLPAVELAIAVSLCFRSIRVFGGVAACCMHVGLLLALGPWGLNHSLGVLLWNIHFFGMALLLFCLPQSLGAVAADSPADSGRISSTDQRVELADQSGRSDGSYVAWFAWVPLGLVLCMPVFERWGYWDHWLSWALYAPHSSRVEIEVASTAVERLPKTLRQQIPDTEGTQLWVRMPIGDWSLADLMVPVYPQSRFQAGIAMYLAERLNSEFEIRATLLGSAARGDGKRSEKTYLGETEIMRLEREFLLNSSPRE